MAKKITDRQAEMLQFVMDTVESRGYPPTIRETKERFGFVSNRGVTIHFDALEYKGFIKRTDGNITVERDREGNRVGLSYVRLQEDADA